MPDDHDCGCTEKGTGAGRCALRGWPAQRHVEAGHALQAESMRAIAQDLRSSALIGLREAIQRFGIASFRWTVRDDVRSSTGVKRVPWRASSPTRCFLLQVRLTLAASCWYLPRRIRALRWGRWAADRCGDRTLGRAPALNLFAARADLQMGKLPKWSSSLGPNSGKMHVSPSAVVDAQRAHRV